MFEVELFKGDQMALVILSVSIALIIDFSAETVQDSFSKLCFINIPTFVNHPSDAMDSIFVRAVQSIAIRNCRAAIRRVKRLHEVTLQIISKLQIFYILVDRALRILVYLPSTQNRKFCPGFHVGFKIFLTRFVDTFHQGLLR